MSQMPPPRPPHIPNAPPTHRLGATGATEPWTKLGDEGDPPEEVRGGERGGSPEGLGGLGGEIMLLCGFGGILVFLGVPNLLGGS